MMPDMVKTGHAQGGGKRLEQQDAFGFSDRGGAEFLQHGGVVAVVADGVGGHSHGKAASEIAVRVFLSAYQSKRPDEPIPNALRRALLAANDAVCEFAQEQGEQENCGTTLTAAVLHLASRSLHWISVGDSRLYLLRGQELAQVTTDGNYASLLLRHTVLDALTQRHMPTPDVEPTALTSSLGMRHLREIDRSLRPFAWQDGDWLVLCTDGVYNTLDVAEMLDCLAAEPQEACDALLRSLVDKDLERQDNATVVILACQPREGQPLPWQRPVQPATSVKKLTRPHPHPKPLLWLGMAIGVAAVLAAWLGWFAQKSARQAEPAEPSPAPAAETSAPPARHMQNIGD